MDHRSCRLSGRSNLLHSQKQISLLK
jgi:hypothetical protein